MDFTALRYFNETAHSRSIRPRRRFGDQPADRKARTRIARTDVRPPGAGDDAHASGKDFADEKASHRSASELLAAAVSASCFSAEAFHARNSAARRRVSGIR
jgi:hypothetical protein